MKVSKTILYGLLMVTLLVPYMAIGHAATPKYLGVSEDQVFEWKTEFDKGPLEDIFEDYGITEEKTIDRYTGAIFDLLEFDEDVVSWKVVVTDIRDDDDKDYDGAIEDEDDVGYVKIRLDIYEKEEGEDWEDLDKSESYKIWEGEEIVYSDYLLASFVEQRIPFTTELGNPATLWLELGMGLYYYDINKLDPIEQDPFDWVVAPEWPMFFAPKNLDYDDVADDCDEWIEDRGYVSNYGGALEDHVSVGTVDVDYFFKSKDVGLKTNIEFNSQFEEFDSEIKYTDDGVMYYYEWEYDGDTIAKFELSMFDQGLEYELENWWWISLIVVAAIVGILILIIVIKKKKS